MMGDPSIDFLTRCNIKKRFISFMTLEKIQCPPSLSNFMGFFTDSETLRQIFLEISLLRTIDLDEQIHLDFNPMEFFINNENQ